MTTTEERMEHANDRSALLRVDEGEGEREEKRREEKRREARQTFELLLRVKINLLSLCDLLENLLDYNSIVLADVPAEGERKEREISGTRREVELFRRRKAGGRTWTYEGVSSMW